MPTRASERTETGDREKDFAVFASPVPAYSYLTRKQVLFVNKVSPGTTYSWQLFLFDQHHYEQVSKSEKNGAANFVPKSPMVNGTPVRSVNERATAVGVLAS